MVGLAVVGAALGAIIIFIGEVVVRLGAVTRLSWLSCVLGAVGLS